MITVYLTNYDLRVGVPTVVTLKIDLIIGVSTLMLDLIYYFGCYQVSLELHPPPSPREHFASLLLNGSLGSDLYVGVQTVVTKAFLDLYIGKKLFHMLLHLPHNIMILTKINWRNIFNSSFLNGNFTSVKIVHFTR